MEGIMSARKNRIYRLALTGLLLLTLLLGGCGVRRTEGAAASPAGTDSAAAPAAVPTATPTEAPTPAAPAAASVSAAPAAAGHPVRDAFAAVLAGEAGFFSTDADTELSLSELGRAVSADSGITAQAVRFTILDLDGDGTPELILGLQVNGDENYGSEILRWQDGTVYGYTLWSRAFGALKQDGTFSYSGGAADNGFGTMRFAAGTWSADWITYSQSTFDVNNNMTVSYFVNGAAASEADFTAAIQLQSEKKDAVWSEYTQENLAAQLAADVQG